MQHKRTQIALHAHIALRTCSDSAGSTTDTERFPRASFCITRFPKFVTFTIAANVCGRDSEQRSSETQQVKR
jgi:hypothetical protein